MLIRTPDEIGRLVSQYRRHRQLTQAQLAAEASVSRAWLIELENGKTTAEIGLIMRVLRALGIELTAPDPTETRGGLPLKEIEPIDIDAIVLSTTGHTQTHKPAGSSNYAGHIISVTDQSRPK